VAKKDRKKLFMGGFLAVLMIFSIAGIIGSGLNSGSYNPPEPIEENGYLFTPSEQGYITEVNGLQIPFAFLPSEIINLSDMNMGISGDRLYISTDLMTNNTGDQAVRRISAIAQTVGTRPVPACYDESCKEDLPLIECPSEVKTLIFTEGPISMFMEDNNCYILQAEDELGFYQLAELISYQTFGIIP